MMMALVEWLSSAGTIMYIILGLAPLVALSGLLHIAFASRKSLVLLCLFLALPLGTGIWATTWERAHCTSLISMAGVLKTQRLEVAARGYREANRPFELALVIVLAGLLPFTLGEMRRSRKSRRSAR